MNKYNDLVGGEAIAAGGFGCIFKPQLECVNKTNKYNKNGISKLMTTKHAKEEQDEINNVNIITKNIKNRNKYFMLDNIYECTPKPLKKTDLINFDKKCKNLKKKNYTAKNINENLEYLQAINMPYGGIDLDKYWAKWHKISDTEKKNKIFNEINNKLIDLLVNGILKLNQNNYYHTDIKSSNILIDIKDDSKISISLKLIDWGLSEKYNNHHVLDNLVNKPIQYNLPYGNILFSKYTNQMINKSKYFSKDHSELLNVLFNKYDILKLVARDIYYKSLSRLGEGHIEFIRYMYHKIYRTVLGRDRQKYNFENRIINYLTEILFKYTNEKNNFDQDKYFKDIYRKNIDIWGFLMCYIEIPLTLSYPWDHELSEHILKIIIKYCLDTKYATQVIPVQDVINDLKKCNNLIKSTKKKLIFRSIPIFNTNSRIKNAGLRSKNITSKILSSFRKSSMLKKNKTSKKSSSKKLSSKKSSSKKSSKKSSSKKSSKKSSSKKSSSKKSSLKKSSKKSSSKNSSSKKLSNYVKKISDRKNTSKFK